MYTSMHLEIDWHKGESRHFLTKEQRRAFSEAVAIGMLEKGTLEINFDEIIEIIRHGVSCSVSPVIPAQYGSTINSCRNFGGNRGCRSGGYGMIGRGVKITGVFHYFFNTLEKVIGNFTGNHIKKIIVLINYVASCKTLHREQETTYCYNLQ